MGHPEHLRILKFGSVDWNKWRMEHPAVVPDLRGAHFKEGRFSRANLSGADLSLAYFGRADLTGADLANANLSEASLRRANFSKSNLHSARLVGADLTRADFFGATMTSADLSAAYLEGANFTRANLNDARLAEADLRLAIATDTTFNRADLTRCRVYGMSVWNTEMDGACQRDLVITRSDENPVTTDNLQVAQFLYLLLNNRAIRDVIETVGRKAILILGRFTHDRKALLERIRDELRAAGLVPILFDFVGPSNRDITETVSTLAHLSRAVIVDITDARSVPQELMAIVPSLPSVPVHPIIAAPQEAYRMFEHFRHFPWVNPIFTYTSDSALCHWLATDFLRTVQA
jgi:uncharacterized protein YjbI with pentapeptide repeats